VCCPTGCSARSPPTAVPKKQCRIVGGRIQNRLVRVELKPATFAFPRPRPDRNPAVQQSHAIVMCYRYPGGPAPRQASVHTSSNVTAQFRWRCRDFCLGFDFCDGSGHGQGPDLGGVDWVFRGCQKPRDECRWQAGRFFYGISYTTSSSAIPRSDARRRTGSRLLVLRIDEEPGCSTTGPVAKIEREAARP
jgi:hypothetical protein